MISHAHMLNPLRWVVEGVIMAQRQPLRFHNPLPVHTIRYVRVEGCVLVLLDGWMVVRFVGVTRVPLCVRVSCVRPVCVPAPPGVFLPVHTTCGRGERDETAPA
jgi:hypothetical protein